MGIKNIIEKNNNITSFRSIRLSPIIRLKIFPINAKEAAISIPSYEYEAAKCIDIGKVAIIASVFLPNGIFFIAKNDINA